MSTLLRASGPGADLPWWKRVDPWVAGEWVAVLLVALFYAAFKTYAMWLQRGDEHIYFAMAQATARGALPYRDFFFAHPPVHLLVPALLFRVFGFSYGLAFWIAPLSCLAAGLALWRLVRRFSAGWVGVLTLCLFLFGRTVLQSASHMTGVNIGMMFLCWGAERLAADKPRTGGVLLALSVLTGIYFLPASAGALALYALFRPRASLRAIGQFLLLGLGVAVVFELLTRGQFLEQVIWYQRAKGGGDLGSSFSTFSDAKGAEVFHNWRLILGAIVGGITGFVVLLLVAESRRKAPRRSIEPARRKSRTSLPPARSSDLAGGAVAAAMCTVAPSAVEEPALPALPRAGVWRWLAGHRVPALAFVGRAGLAAGRGLAAVRRGTVGACRPAPWAALGIAGALWTALHWLFLALLPIVWRYYFAVLFVGAAATTALAAFAVWRGLRVLRDRRRGATWSPVFFGGVVAVAYVLGYGHDLALARKYDIWNEDDQGKKAAVCDPQSCALGCTNKGNVDGRCDTAKGCICAYGWHDSPASWVPHWFNATVRSLFWGGTEIPDGRRYGWLENTLWHESRGAPVEPRFLEAAHAIEARACPGDTVFGDSGSAPMLANLTGLRVAANYFDTNMQRFDTGFIEAPAQIVARIKADGVRFIVLAGNTWAKDGPIADLLKNDFRPLWPGPGDPPFGVTVYVTKAPGKCEGR